MDMRIHLDCNNTLRTRRKDRLFARDDAGQGVAAGAVPNTRVTTSTEPDTRENDVDRADWQRAEKAVQRRRVR